MQRTSRNEYIQKVKKLKNDDNISTAFTKQEAPGKHRSASNWWSARTTPIWSTIEADRPKAIYRSTLYAFCRSNVKEQRTSLLPATRGREKYCKHICTYILLAIAIGLELQQERRSYPRGPPMPQRSFPTSVSQSLRSFGKRSFPPPPSTLDNWIRPLRSIYLPPERLSSISALRCLQALVQL